MPPGHFFAQFIQLLLQLADLGQTIAFRGQVQAQGSEFQNAVHERPCGLWIAPALKRKAIDQNLLREAVPQLQNTQGNSRASPRRGNA